MRPLRVWQGQTVMADIYFEDRGVVVVSMVLVATPSPDATALDTSGTAASPTGVRVSVIAPDGTVTLVAVSGVSAGRYRAFVAAVEGGTYAVRASCDGPNTAATEAIFASVASLVGITGIGVTNAMLREDGTLMLREDGSILLRE
jgi:hypothetical protein